MEMGNPFSNPVPAIVDFGFFGKVDQGLPYAKWLKKEGKKNSLANFNKWLQVQTKLRNKKYGNTKSKKG